MNGIGKFTLIVLSYEPLMSKVEVKYLRYHTPFKWPLNVCVHRPSFKFHIFIVLSALPVAIL